tara:strand:- start:45405 stop:45962 length:558 start_codon:yes stop_codon:yes gene_type:complete
MKSLTSHTIRTATIYLLMAGFMVHLIVPFSSSAQKIAFAQWLDQNVVVTGNESEAKLRNSIRELPEQSGDLWILIQQASELVKNNKDDFRINFSFDDSEHQQVSSWLVSQWSVFQNHSDASNAVLPEVNFSIIKWLTLNSHSNGVFTQSVPKLFDLIQAEFGNRASVWILKAISPLKSGISINAP